MRQIIDEIVLQIVDEEGALGEWKDFSTCKINHPLMRETLKHWFQHPPSDIRRIIRRKMEIEEILDLDSFDAS